MIDDIYNIRHLLDSDIAIKRYKYSRFPDQLTIEPAKMSLIQLKIPKAEIRFFNIQSSV